MLGVGPDASPEDIKAAWRRLARTNHPDLTGDDPAASQRATRRMAEINAAYASLTREDRRRARVRQDDGDGTAAGAATGGARRRGGPPRPRPTRPVTGRLDTTDTFRPRNQTITPPLGRHPLAGHPPRRRDASRPDLRASDPTGDVLRDRLRDHTPPPVPTLDEALETELDFGKFRGHTLGEVAAFEPSYIDWVATAVARDPGLTLAARVVRDELDRRGIRRTSRPVRPGWRSNPFV